MDSQATPNPLFRATLRNGDVLEYFVDPSGSLKGSLFLNGKQVVIAGNVVEEFVRRTKLDRGEPPKAA